MAETAQKKITLNNFFEQIVEINKVSQKAMEKSNESLSVSEKTKIDLERLIQLLKVDFNKETENIIREDATEDRELRDSFLQLQSSFNDLSGAINIIRKDLDSLSDAFLQSQKGRRSALKQRDRQISKEEDTLQKEQILGQKSGGKISSTDQDYKRSVEQKENKALSALKGLLGGGLLTGLGAAFGGGGGSPGDIPSMGDLSGDQQEAENKTYDQVSKTEGKNVALGMLANAMRESGYRTDAPEGGFFGMFQWDKNREANLREYAKSKGKSPYDRDVQVEFALMEAQQSGTLGRMKAAKSPEEAASIFYNEFERAAYSKPIQGDKYDPNNPHEALNKTYLDQIRQRQQVREQTVERHKLERQKLEVERPANQQRSEAEAKEIEERHKKLREQALLPLLHKKHREQALLPQSLITPQKKEGVPDLQKPSASIASVTLPPVSGGTQQVGGGQGRGQASTNSYGVKSTTNNMMFAQVLSGSFADKMNIAV